MAGKDTDDIDLEDIGKREREREAAEQEGEEETNVDDERRRDESILIIDG